MYLAFKHLHMTAAYLSITGFLIRGLFMFLESPRRQHRFWRIAPHINDTVLLGCALFLVISSHQYPFQLDWLTAKLIALITYILLGFVAFRFGRSKTQRTTAFLLAILTFAYILSVAMTRNALPFL